MEIKFAEFESLVTSVKEAKERVSVQVPYFWRQCLNLFWS